jgi:hypothetical protein
VKDARRDQASVSRLRRTLRRWWFTGPVLVIVGALVAGTSLSGCSTDRWVEVAAGTYAPVHGSRASGPSPAIETVRVDRDNQTAWFVLDDGSLIPALFTPLPRAEWPTGCPTNIHSTRMEVLELEMEALTIGSITFHRPVLVRDCPPDPEEIVLLSSGDIGVHGTACGGAGQCTSFERASGAISLPRSMKGYELYCWHVSEEDGWSYTLVTGTNRTKSYAEILTPESVITQDDWVKITVRGTGSLRSALDLLPAGETVVWRGAGWLEGAPPAGDPFPDRAVVREIERYCQDRSIHLDVAGAPDVAF